MPDNPRHALTRFPVGPTVRRALLGLVALAGTSAVVLACAPPSLATPATPAVASTPAGHLTPATRGPHSVLAAGYVGGTTAAVGVTVTVDGRGRAHVVADHRRPGIGTRTAFSTRVMLTPAAHRVCAFAGVRGGALRPLGCFSVPAAWVAQNAAIARLAAHFVGSRYVHGGRTPKGFDCSGFVYYVYRHAARITTVPLAQTQRDHAHPLTRATARAGDLVFFYAGRHVYHVAIYAGRDAIWAAATARDGVVHQRIWSSAISFGSYTHS